ncbi:protein KRBA1 [Pteronotus mesoamericanus]|uniref:protein KRBA1 n=1 Tax=Pteronotus mesoamericanus TaxID=1884717 RepID=UPI0023EB3C0A|nr:protein KRBA1 [Pteronotus parnellii mesoamericanus]
MQENYEALASLGTAELVPLSAFLSPAEPGGARSKAGEGQPPLGCGLSAGGAPQHSLHLTALVQLVKEIPGFLFGEVGPEGGGAGPEGERPGPGAAVTVDTCPLQGLLSRLPDTPVGRPGLATTPSGSSSSSGSPGAVGQGSPLPIKTADTPGPAEQEGPGTPGGEHSPPTGSPGRRKSHRKQQRGASGAGSAGASPGNSPLQGLINCLKEILVPGPQHPEAPPRLPPVPGPGLARPPRVGLGPGSPPCGVKTEAVAGGCPLQGLLNCLKEIPVAQDKHPSPSGRGDPWLPEDPGAWKRTSGGPRPPQTPPPCPGAGRVLSVKMEDSWAQSPPVPASCQLRKPTHSPCATGSQGGDRDTRGVRVPSWGPAAQASSASSSPLEALEACLKGIPLSGSLPPQPPAPSWFRSPQPGDPGSPRPELLPRGSHSQEAMAGPLLALGLQGFARDGSALPPGPRGTPTSCSSSSSTDGDLDFQSHEGSQGRRPGKGIPVGSAPLQGLENCLREIPVPKSQPAWPWSSAGDREPRRMEPKTWTADKEAGLRSAVWETVHLRRDTPTRSLWPASPQALSSSSAPACCQRGLRDHAAARPGPWRWLPDGAASTPSPLHCLENSLKGILPGRPLRFACLAGPGPSPSPGTGSSSSAGSSFSSSEGEDPRLEPELWQPLLQERNPLPSSKSPSPPTPRPGGPPAGRSPAGGRRGAEPREHFGLSAGAAGSLCPAPWPEKRPGLGPCPPPGSAPQPLFRKPRVGDESGGPGPGHRGPSAAARTEERPHPGGLPEPAPEATASPALPPAAPRPPCPCGGSLQQELRGLSAALAEKLERLAAALAGLSQEVATVRAQVGQLGRRPQGPGSKSRASWPWAPRRGPHWAHSPAHRHLPHRRQKGPTRPRPKILRSQAEGCRAGEAAGLSRGALHLVPQLPPGAPQAESSGTSSSPSQQPPSSAFSRAGLPVHPPLRHTGGPQSPPAPSAPAAFPPQMASPASRADAEPPAAAAVPTETQSWPKDVNGLLAGVQRALKEELWGGEHRDPRWVAPNRLLHQLVPEDALPPVASPRGQPAPTRRSSQTFPIPGL